MKEGTCKHYTGDYHNTHCAAGVCYRDVTSDPDNRLGVAFRKPCVNWDATIKRMPLSESQLEQWAKRGKCDKYQEPTAEEVKKFDEELEAHMNQFSNKVTLARQHILEDLRRRFLEREPVTAPADISRFYQPQKNYFCGSGKMKCPICNTGELQYSRSSYNGHVHARCSTKDCVAWME